MIDLRHPLAVLANRMPCTSIQLPVTQMFGRRVHEGRLSAEVDLFGDDYWYDRRHTGSAGG